MYHHPISLGFWNPVRLDIKIYWADHWSFLKHRKSCIKLYALFILNWMPTPIASNWAGTTYVSSAKTHTPKLMWASSSSWYRCLGVESWVLAMSNLSHCFSSVSIGCSNNEAVLLFMLYPVYSCCAALILWYGETSSFDLDMSLYSICFFSNEAYWGHVEKETCCCYARPCGGSIVMCHD